MELMENKAGHPDDSWIHSLPAGEGREGSLQGEIGHRPSPFPASASLFPGDPSQLCGPAGQRGLHLTVT